MEISAIYGDEHTILLVGQNAQFLDATAALTQAYIH
jgi:hypothetical protein